MLPGMMGGQMGVLQPNANMIEVIRTLGLEANLKLCLDAGDAASYTSGQTWSDRSGGAYDFFRGTTSGAEGSDPTFNGVAGRQSSAEYFSVDGGDWFTLGQANPSWLESFHKASAKLTIVQMVYVNAGNATSDISAIMGDSPIGSGSGFQLGISATVLRAMNYSVYNGASTVYSKNSTTTANNNAWNFLATSADMVGGTVLFQTNATTDTFTSQSYSSPSAGASTGTIRLDDVTGGGAPSKSGCRRAITAMWDRALSATELTNLSAAIRPKFGI